MIILNSTKKYWSDAVIRGSFIRITGILIGLTVLIFGFHSRILSENPFDLRALMWKLSFAIPTIVFFAFFYWRRVVKAAIQEVGGWQQLLEMNYHDKNNLLKRMESEKIK